ncbi:DUF7007 domain-containing protein [Aureimonas ureilytica]|uniref:DUF7007 domain-containing protein n=1 Tax=Aureimonas ureilytica TaxID=401562 RepID=UPI00036793CC|nr:hypothetical protein [Aureimonas ureilytica]
MSALVAAYGRTADNLVAARYGDDAYAMVPKRGGGFFVAMGWHLQGHFSDWNRDNFFSHCGDVAGEDGFKAHVEEALRHKREKAALGRQSQSLRHETPWGTAQHAETYGAGIVAYSTAGHGGFHVAPKANARIHPALRATDGWYEEDRAWAAIALAFGELFTTMERKSARKTIRNAQPDAYEAIFTTTLTPGESHAKDRRAFQAANVANWIVGSAIILDERPGFTEVVASVGDQHQERRRFLIPRGEYEVGRFGFVVDPARYEELPDDAPSAFIGWRR